MANMNLQEDNQVAGEYNAAPCIYLNDDQVEALGITEPPKPGTVYVLRCKAVATRVTAEAEEADEMATEGAAPDVYLTLRLDDIEVQSSLSQSPMAAAASALYGGA